MYFLERYAGEKCDGRHGPARTDPNAWYQPIVRRLQIIDRWDQTEVHVAIVQQLGADRRDVVAQLPVPRSTIQRPRQRARVQISNRAQAHRPATSLGEV